MVGVWGAGGTIDAEVTIATLHFCDPFHLLSYSLPPSLSLSPPLSLSLHFLSPISFSLPLSPLCLSFLSFLPLSPLDLFILFISRFFLLFLLFLSSLNSLPCPPEPPDFGDPLILRHGCNVEHVVSLFSIMGKHKQKPPPPPPLVKSLHMLSMPYK